MGVVIHYTNKAVYDSTYIVSLEILGDSISLLLYIHLDSFNVCLLALFVILTIIDFHYGRK